MSNKVQFPQATRQWMDVFMHRSMRNLHQFAKSSGLSMPQFSIMMQLHHRGACAVSDIGERFEISNAAASQLVDKLVHAGYLERTEDPSDRRSKILNLTDKGRSFVQQGFEERHRWMDEVLMSLSADERVKVEEALTILAEAAQRLDEKV